MIFHKTSRHRSLKEHVEEELGLGGWVGGGEVSTCIGQIASRLVEPPWHNAADMRRAMAGRSTFICLVIS